MSCISEDSQVKQNILVNVYAIALSLTAGLTSGFGLAVWLNVQVDDRTPLGLAMLVFSFFMLSMLLFSLYIYHKTAKRDEGIF